MKVIVTPLSPHALKLRLIKLGLFSSPLIGAYVFSHTSYSSPLFCPLKTFTGIPCPGCGLTRSFLAISQGNFPLAFDYHLFGPLVFFGFLLTSIHLILEIIIQKKIQGIYGVILENKKLQFGGLLVLLTYHATRLYRLSLTGELSIQFHQSPLGKIL